MAAIKRSHWSDTRAGPIVKGMSTPTTATCPPEPPPQSWDPALYAARASFVHRLAADLVDLLAPRPRERVLDLGCGAGELTERIAATGATVVGLDASPEMLDAARRRAPRLKFVAGDGQALRFDSEFDAVFSNAALHWMPRADDVAAGVARSLRPGGRFVAELGGRGCVATVCEAVAAALVRRGDDPGHWLRWYFPDVREYVTVLAAAGLDVRLAHLFERPTRVEGDEGLRQWLRTFLPRLEPHLGGSWTDFAREVETRCEPELRREGGWVLDYVRLRVVAVRPPA
jgi:trans-aconitate methyltransferase